MGWPSGAKEQAGKHSVKNANTVRAQRRTPHSLLRADRPAESGRVSGKTPNEDVSKDDTGNSEGVVFIPHLPTRDVFPSAGGRARI